MLAQDRYAKILKMLNQEKSIKVSALTKLFNVSIDTVRRDLESLEKEGLLKRVYGGAVLEKTNSKELHFTERETKHIEEKKEIGEIACRYIKEGQSIAMDVSTTNHEIAKAMKNKFDKLTIITNSLLIAMEFCNKEKYNIILTGGLLRQEELCIVGNLAENFIKNFHIDTAFISMSGISINEELTDYGLGELQIKRKMMERAQQVIVVADSSKFDVVSLLKAASFDEIDAIITDSKLNKKVLDKYKEFGIEITNE
ncbi:DeoR/GlpR transcriptional regulator [Clostridium sp. P21]|uniref:DeoR/GlpR transcriptional regulator n=1 Tax=Clostridium muellerianum TaxID=2716538 RepID=A0A7Y0EKL3_9CLOT|nr:DeoR/GlpR family DNA-binding transcription regulator [Clostridium muellerianum]NMM65203.1 DeoR/GlpR transcriptional regulator [Clostridium muellerianum]